MRSFTLLFAICLVSLVALSQSLPVPARYGGYKKGNPSAPVMIEMWGDFQCLDCREAWPILRQVMAHYGEQKLFFILHAFPLVMHRQAWDVACTAAVVAQQPNIQSEHLYQFFDFLWTNQPSFSNAAFFQKSESDLYNLMSGYAAKWGVDNSTFYTSISSSQTFNLAYNAVQMGADRHVHSTPTFYINGIPSTFDEKTTFNQWVSFIDGLITGN